jgi:glycosyltransferase involved in cell wall biosynthesis
MILDTNFKGRVFQVMEALDFGDAVSNHAVELDGMLRQLGLETGLYSKWHHEKMRDACIDLNELKPTDEDVVILHFSGHSQYALPYLQELRCTKICLYHNITPHTFFKKGTALHEHCLKGREQLQEIIRDFHYFWGVSKYNLQELIEAGVNPKTCAIVPIVVNPSRISSNTTQTREAGAWMFLGRIASNKGHAKLVDLFASVRQERPSLASKLYLVGGWQATDPCYKELIQQVSRLGLSDCIVITGKVADAEVENYFARASIYVSASEHEGFGVPLIEAAHRDLVVVALTKAAVGETLGNATTICTTMDDLQRAIVDILSNATLYQATLELQKNNALRFSSSEVTQHLANGLSVTLPKKGHYQTVSIVICTYNRGDLLERCLDYLQYQTNQNFEVVVVNGPSTDNTATVLQKYKNQIKLGNNPERNLSKSRNIGIELADGDIVAFIDDDALPFDDWVDTLLFEFSRRPLTVAGLGGPAYYAGSLEFQAQDNGVNNLAEAWVSIPSTEIGKNGWQRYPTGTNCAFNAEALRKTNGFDEQFDYYLDESELCYRLQLQNQLVSYCENLYLRHEFAQSHNRSGKYKYNWYTICKNTAYYIAAYSGFKGKELADYIDARMNKERILPITAGRDAGEITPKDYAEYVEAIRSGFKQGLDDAKHFPRTRLLNKAPGTFQLYTQAADHPLIGRDIQRLHICIISKEFPPFARAGGVGTLYYHLASELLLMGHEVTVILPSNNDSTYQRGRFTVVYATRHEVCSDTLGANGFASNANWSISALHAIAKLHSERPISIVETALWDSEALAFSLIPADDRPPLVVRLVTPFPVSSKINGWQVSDREGMLYTAAERAMIDNADAIVPISESIARTITKEYKLVKDERWNQSYCGIAYWAFFDVNFGYSSLGEENGVKLNLPKDAKIVLFVGRLESRKGIDLLLQAADNFLSRDSSVHLVVAGRDIEGWTERAKLLISKSSAIRTHFLGEVDDATREKLLHAAHCVVFPSRYESFGLVPLEAFVHGVPVVATNAAAIPEVVLDNVCGLLFNPDDARSLADCICRLMLEPGLRDRLSQGAYKRVKQLSSRNSAIRAVTLYKKLVKQLQPFHN